jgi:ribosomal protein S18 acetylase RimI-like enzyme
MSGPSTGASAIRAVTEADVDQVARTMARAFTGDPFMGWLIPESRWPGAFERWDRCQLVHSFLPRLICQTTPDAVAAAFWAPPGPKPASPEAEAVVDRGSREAFADRYELAMAAFELLHENAPEEPSWRLVQVGTHPDWRGRGVGERLLRTQLDEIDRSDAAAFLEVSNPRVVPFYTRLGFEVTKQVEVPEGGPVVPLMYRPARSRREG